MNILYAALVLGAMAIIFGLLLTFLSKKFAVEPNPVRDAVREALPSANCGGCGYPGCDGCADAIVAGKAPVNACPVGGAAVAEAVAKAMGVEAAPATEKVVATVVCQGDSGNCSSKFNYTGIHDCVAATLVAGGNKSCKYACLGLGTCVRNCPFDAIHINKELGIAEVDPDKCQACGKCVAACPKEVLALQPMKQKVAIKCRAMEKGKLVMENCKHGCIGCGKCEKTCKFGAITIVNNLPVIDYTKCRSCMMCAEACPTDALWADFDNRLKADIDENMCVGCTKCKRVCQFESIIGELKHPHMILDACTGCGICAENCPKKAITMKVRDHVRDANSKAGTSEATDEI